MADLTQRLAILIDGNSTGGVSALDKVAVAADKAAVAEAKLGVAQAKAAGDAEGLAAAQAKLAGAQNSLGVTKAQTDLTKAQNELTASTAASGNAFAKLAPQITPAKGVLIGLAADVAAIKIGDSLINQFTSSTEAVRKFQLISGASATDASKLTYAFRQLGVDSDTAGTAFFRLAHNVEGSKDALAQFGVAVAKNKNGSVDLSGTVLNIADAMQKAGPGAEADAIAFAAFGRQAAALTPLLSQGRDGVEAFYAAAGKSGQVFNQSDVDKGHQFTLEMKQVQEEMKGVEVEAGRMLLPLAKSIAGVAGPVLGFFDGIYKRVDSIESHFPSWLRGEAFKHGGDSAAAAADAVSQLNDAITAQTPAATAATKAVSDLATATTAMDDAQKTLASAQRSVASATRAEADDRTALNKLLAQGKVNADAVASAEKGVAAAAKATADAQKAEAAAGQKVADARQAVLDAEAALAKVEQGASAEDVGKATLAEAKAKRDQQRAILAVGDAQDKTNSIVEVGLVGAGQQVGTAEDQLKASFDLADALDGVQSSAYDTADATAALVKTQQEGKAGSDTFKAAQDALEQKQKDLTQAIQDQADAHQNVIDKQQAQIDAGAALTKAQAGDPDWDQKVADAQQKIADAHQNTVDQINAERDAVDALNKSEATLDSDRRGRQATQDAALAGYQAQGDFASQRGGLAGPGAGYTGGVTVTVPLTIDGKQFAQATARYTADELARIARANGIS